MPYAPFNIDEYYYFFFLWFLLFIHTFVVSFITAAVRSLIFRDWNWEFVEMFLIKSSSFHLIRFWKLFHLSKTHVSNKYMISIMMIWRSVIFISGTLFCDFYSVCSVIKRMKSAKYLVHKNQLKWAQPHKINA